MRELEKIPHKEYEADFWGETDPPGHFSLKDKEKIDEERYQKWKKLGYKGTKEGIKDISYDVWFEERYFGEL